MCKVNRAVLIALALTLLLPISSLAQSGSIEQIEVLGLYRMTREAFLHALGMKVGDPFDEALLRDRYKALWDLGLFEDIVVEKETGPQGGAVLVIKVRERPVLTSVTFEDNKVATRTNIEDRMKERKIGLDLGKPIDMRAIFFAESAIRDLLGEKGFLDAEVEATVRKVTETTRAVNFAVTSGGKTRIRAIHFKGNTIFSDRKLAGELELTEKRKWYWPWSAKNLYHPAKWDQDVIKIRELYQNRGYLDIEIRPPIVDIKTGGKQKESPPESEPPPEAALPAEPDLSGLTPKEREKWEKQQKAARKKERKKKAVKRWAELTVPIVEGEQYVTGDLTVEGNDVFPAELLRALIPLREGEIFRNNILDAAVEGIRRMYEDRGHLYATVVRRIERREEEKIADIELFIEEDEPYYVARIEFRGNSKTHDRVLRREILMAEGELFNRTKLNISKMKVNQLGYFQVPEDPLIEPIADEKRVNVTFDGQEQGRNEIQIGGGYSGYEGAFFNGVYSTRNFLGRGQILSAALQIGGRSDSYQISVQEPWFLGRPYRLGFSVYRRDIEYGYSLRSSSTGGGVVIGKRIKRFANIDLSYNWESVSSRSILAATSDTDSDGANTYSTDLNISSLTPVYFFSTINNPYRPTRGKSWRISTQIAGGPLGGQVSFVKPIVSFTGYRRAFRKTHFGFHARVGFVKELEDTGFVNSSSIEGIPRYHRFWLGGDTLGPRVFESRTITPRRYVILDVDGNILDVLGDPRLHPADDFVGSGGVPVPIEVGGDRFFLLQSEFVWPLNEQAELAFFVDVGDALFEDQSWGFDTARVAAGVEVRFHLPIFPVPLRLIYGVPVRELEGDRSSNFTFSIGKSF
jgi:outer membrane protein insertion porin family